MGTNVTNEGGISRRSFLGGVAGVGALAAMGLAGCSPKAAGTTGAESASNSASTAAGIADNNAVAVDDGSAAITVDWLGAPPEIGDITETKDTDLLIVGAGNGGMIAGAYASDQKMDFILCEKGTEWAPRATGSTPSTPSPSPTRATTPTAPACTASGLAIPAARATTTSSTCG